MERAKNCRRRYQGTVEEGYQEETRKRKAGRKNNNAKKANKGRRKMRKLKKELEALSGWLWKDTTPYKGGIARRWRMKKKKKKAGKKATTSHYKWEEEQHLEDIVESRRMEGSSLKLHKKYLSWW